MTCLTPRVCWVSRALPSIRVQTFDGVIETARRIAAEKLRPHNRSGDREEPTVENGRVRIIPEVKDALDAIAEAGLCRPP